MSHFPIAKCKPFFLEAIQTVKSTELHWAAQPTLCLRGNLGHLAGGVFFGPVGDLYCGGLRDPAPGRGTIGIPMKHLGYPGLNFTYGVGTLILYQSLKIPNLSHYKMMVLNLQGITENDNMILLQNEDWFLSSSYLKGTLHHYKMKICFYVFLSSGYLKETLPKGNFPCYKMRLGFYMLSSDGQILLLQNDFRFLKVFQLPKRWQLIKCNSQAVGTKCLAHPHFFILI